MAAVRVKKLYNGYLNILCVVCERDACDASVWETMERSALVT
jgi:hypothetical protein